ncbi:YqfO family protein [Parathalassolituus penaei]|uniref:YqfO family protein n=1 Tax=Parathalassolituus penaei TaxID=2997323 RepID=A0A9X3EQ55_9GAMM|nr:YqfO family protein [Parathalassolituus penaei]MCY0966823.1 YqfO family protein [Parathalassolituus penaei]
MYKLVFFVPESHLESVKTAVLATGAGQIGDYDSCCWQIKGMGQFRPLAAANPFIGSAGVLEQVDEYRVELVCADALIREAVQALVAAHPYEEPAWDVTRLVDVLAADFKP